MIIITSKQDGFRRCGVSHPLKPTTYSDDKFSDTELDALKTEPMLTVTHKEGKGAPGSKKKKEDAAKKSAAAKRSAAAKKAAATKKANAAKKAAEANKEAKPATTDGADKASASGDK